MCWMGWSTWIIFSCVSFVNELTRCLNKCRRHRMTHQWIDFSSVKRLNQHQPAIYWIPDQCLCSCYSQAPGRPLVDFLVRSVWMSNSGREEISLKKHLDFHDLSLVAVKVMRGDGDVGGWEAGSGVLISSPGSLLSVFWLFLEVSAARRYFLVKTHLSWMGAEWRIIPFLQPLSAAINSVWALFHTPAPPTQSLALLFFPCIYRSVSGKWGCDRVYFNPGPQCIHVCVCVCMFISSDIHLTSLLS